jgi:hypothetical protein
MAEVLDEDIGLSFMRDIEDKTVDLSNAFLEISNLLERELLNYECTLTYDDIRVSFMRVVLSKDGLNYKLYWKDDIQCMTNNSRAISWIAYDLLKNGPLTAERRAA